MWGKVEEVSGRCEEVCWGVGEVRGDLGRGVGGVL